MDRIILSGLEVYAHGGVTEAEKQIGQRYRVTVVLSADLTAAARTDDIADTIHYGEVYESVTAAMRERRFNLIESVAGRIATRLLDDFPSEEVTVRVEKLLPPIDGIIASAAAEVTRRRSRRGEDQPGGA